jgi:hypothetical protein
MVEQSGSSTAEACRVERLSHVLAEEGIERVRTIKVDVEGFELEVLRGCKELLRGSEPPILCVEYGVYGPGSEALLTYLRSLEGYRLFQLVRGKTFIS